MNLPFPIAATPKGIIRLGRSLDEQGRDRARVAGKVTQFWLVRGLMILALLAWASTLWSGLGRMFQSLQGAV